MIDYLPKEVAQDILLRVPIKSLVKCTAVCNSWRSMIKNRDFICAHLKHTIEYNNQYGTHLLLLHSTPRSFRSNLSRPEEELCSLHYDNHAFDEYCKVEFPIAQNLHNGFLCVVGICNGLVFLADDYLSLGYTFIICNPSVRKSVTLPKPSLNFATCGPYSASMGFGFHAETNDYKVVRLVTDQCNNPTQFEVYSLATGSWSSPRIVAPRCYIPDRTTHIFVNGAIHWEARYCILSFDVGSELFRKIMMPKCLEHGEWWRFQICLLEDGKSLSLLVVDNGWTSLDIWVLKEYCMEDSWTKLITLSTQLPESSVAPSEPLCFMKCGEIVYVMSKRYGGRHTKLVSLDIVSKQFKDLGSREYPFHYAYSYEESLLLLDRPDAASY